MSSIVNAWIANTMTFETAPRPPCVVLIPHYNDPRRLSRCLSALMPQVTEDVDVVVVDNGSDVDLSEVRTRFDAVRFVTEERSGAGPARNRGVAESTAPILLFLDADCVPAVDWVAVGREVARPNIVVGGRVDIFHETPAPRSGAEVFEDIFAFHMKTYLDRDSFVGSGNLSLLRTTFERVGGFRPAVSEDKEWSQRAAAMGVELTYDDRFVVSHPSRSDWMALQAKWRRLTQESFMLRCARGEGRTGWVIRALAMPPSAIAHSHKILRRNDISLMERLSGLWTLHRLRWARMVWMLQQVSTRDKDRS